MKNIKSILLLALLLAGSVSLFAGTTIPLSIGSYLTTGESATTGTIKNNDGGNLGSIKTGATATFTLTNESAQEMVLCFLTGTSNTNAPTVTVTLTDGSKELYTSGVVAIANTRGYGPVTKHLFELGTVPAGTFSLQFSFAASDNNYVCNLGSIGVYNKLAYLATLDEMPGDITLSKGK